jgi:predicted transcriptional regulator
VAGVVPLIYGIVSVMKNFHVPLPDETYMQLRAAAERSNVPATSLAREAIDSWLRQQFRKAQHEAIASFASESAGTSFDLDPDLEAAGIEHLLKERTDGK